MSTYSSGCTRKGVSMSDSLFIYGINAEDTIYNSVRDEQNMIEQSRLQKNCGKHTVSMQTLISNSRYKRSSIPVFGKCI